MRKGGVAVHFATAGPTDSDCNPAAACRCSGLAAGRTCSAAMVRIGMACALACQLCCWQPPPLPLRLLLPLPPLMLSGPPLRHKE